jgi:hypothetical protein
MNSNSEEVFTIVIEKDPGQKTTKLGHITLAKKIRKSIVRSQG